MTKTKIALIYGGTSSEREVSIAGKNAVFEAIDKQTYEVYCYDSKHDLAKLLVNADTIDFAFIVLHGENGEDGRIQGFLDLLKIPYQSSGVFTSALAMNKEKCKEFYRLNNIPTARHIVFKKYGVETENEIISKIGLPVVIKPAIGGSSIALSIIEEQKDLKEAALKALDESEFVMAEEYISGTELTCAIIGNDEPEALPVIEIRPKEGHKFFDYVAKYTAGETDEICPAQIDDETALQAKKLCIKIHKALGCKGCSRTDLILKEGKFYVLETNTIPGMTKNSLLPLAARTAGISFTELIDRLIKLSLKK
ncbi:MAG: D-alanine--D-alanine ligase [Desulfobacteraceae bacterium]|nr:D-alanine--D-alanine ligase [Desulfobacteraceae bacterium]